MTTEYAPFDASNYLDSDAMIAEYLTAAAEDDDPNVLLAALADVAKGMANVAQAAGLGRESLYKTLAPGARPRFQTVQAILKALNVRMSLNAPASTKLAKAHRRTSQPEAAQETTKKAAAKKRYLAARKAAAKRAPQTKQRA